MAMTFLEILEYGGVGMDFSKCNMAIKTWFYRGLRGQLEGAATPVFPKSSKKVKLLMYVKDSSRKTGCLAISLEKNLIFQIRKYILIVWVIMNTCGIFFKG